MPPATTLVRVTPHHGLRPPRSKQRTSSNRRLRRCHGSDLLDNTGHKANFPCPYNLLLCCTKSSIISVHNIHNVYFNNPKQVEKFSGDNFTCVCANCNQFVTFKQMTSGKGCEKCVAASKEVGTGGGATEKAKEFECPYCGRVFKEQVQIEMHLCNGWCKELKRKTFQSTDRDWATSGIFFCCLS